jgi:ABC-2 type transport system ATP-binding protein
LETDRDTRRVTAPAADRVTALTEVVRALHEARIAVSDIGTRRPTLDEVFLHLTGTTPVTPGAAPAAPAKEAV